MKYEKNHTLIQKSIFQLFDVKVPGDVIETSPARLEFKR